jgi:hypothetical protein
MSSRCSYFFILLRRFDVNNALRLEDEILLLNTIVHYFVTVGSGNIYISSGVSFRNSR